MTEFLKSIADAKWFQNFIIGVILSAGVVVGIQTYEGFTEKHQFVLSILDQSILWIFVIEVLIKMGAEGRRPWRYFLDPWNVFDFIIVAVCFMPFGGSMVAVLRLARLLRVFKLVRALPELQIIVAALLKSIPSMFYISVLLFLLFYLYSVLAVFTFGHNDPVHFADLQTAMLSMFRVATLEDWTDVMYINMYGCANYGYGGNEAICTESAAFGWWAAAFFSSFVLVATMIILNLFVGVIMSGMDEARAEMAADMRAADAAAVAAGEADQTKVLSHQLGVLSEQLATIQTEIMDLSKKVASTSP
jgi:voltage-gated sodium channel